MTALEAGWVEPAGGGKRVVAGCQRPHVLCALAGVGEAPGVEAVGSGRLTVFMSVTRDNHCSAHAPQDFQNGLTLVQVAL